MGFGVWGLRFGVLGLGFNLLGVGFQVSGLGFWVSGFGPRGQYSVSRIPALECVIEVRDVEV